MKNGMVNELRSVMDDRGIKGAWLAKKVGVRTGTISNIKNGKTAPELETALRIAHVLNLRVEDIWRLRD